MILNSPFHRRMSLLQKGTFLAFISLLGFLIALKKIYDCKTHLLVWQSLLRYSNPRISRDDFTMAVVITATKFQFNGAFFADTGTEPESGSCNIETFPFIMDRQITIERTRKVVKLAFKKI